MRAPRLVIAAVLPILVTLPSVVSPAAASRPAAGVPFSSPGGLVIVRAAARGDGGRTRDLRLLLDTGDPGGVTLFASAARALELSPGPVRPGVAHGLNRSRSIERRGAVLPALALDDMTWRELPIDVTERADSLPDGIGAQVEGVIGAGTVVTARLTIDYAARRLWLAPTADEEGSMPVPVAGSAASPPGESTEILSFVEGRLLAWIDAEGTTIPALIDTASARSLIEPGAGLAPATCGRVRLADAAGGATSYATIRVRDLVVGGAAIESADMVEVDLGRRLAPILSPGSPRLRAVIGADILSGHRVVIDAAAGRFILELAPAPPEQSPARSAPGLAVPDASRRPARPPESAGRTAGTRPGPSD
jgi:hypothetical protein